MKKAPTPTKMQGAFEIRNQRGDSTACKRFSGTDNPRHLRVLHALLASTQPREGIDYQAGCSNAPELIAELRRRGLELPCDKTPCIDRDGFEVRRGIYYLTDKDRFMVRAWLRVRARGRNG
jgi:hypothetical protein